MIAADRIAPAIVAPALVGADVTNTERMLCVIGILHIRFAEVLTRISEAVRQLAKLDDGKLPQLWHTAAYAQYRTQLDATRAQDHPLRGAKPPAPQSLSATAQLLREGR
jgi:hypothetical protein